MRTDTKIIHTDIYTFEELTEEQKELALENLHDINLDYEWWDFTFSDAKEIGLELTEFDLDRNRHAKGDFILSPKEVAEKILSNHGENCETVQTAKDYLAEYTRLVKEQGQEDADFLSEPGNASHYDSYCEYNFEVDTCEIDQDFLNSLLEDYSIMLQKGYEYLGSREAIIETIQANEYEFTEDGNIY